MVEDVVDVDVDVVDDVVVGDAVVVELNVVDIVELDVVVDEEEVVEASVEDGREDEAAAAVPSSFPARVTMMARRAMPMTPPTAMIAHSWLRFMTTPT